MAASRSFEAACCAAPRLALLAALFGSQYQHGSARAQQPQPSMTPTFSPTTTSPTTTASLFSPGCYSGSKVARFDELCSSQYAKVCFEKGTSGYTCLNCEGAFYEYDCSDCNCKITISAVVGVVLAVLVFMFAFCVFVSLFCVGCPLVGRLSASAVTENRKETEKQCNGQRPQRDLELTVVQISPMCTVDETNSAENEEKGIEVCKDSTSEGGTLEIGELSRSGTEYKEAEDGSPDEPVEVATCTAVGERTPRTSHH
mmetsp:Transcript_12898/g.31619  ORF Transcript_12898/g.31619 Transcript_12898/m.31619 type:complete len:257 (+) Transcript_12898:57-827(+)